MEYKLFLDCSDNDFSFNSVFKSSIVKNIPPKQPGLLLQERMGYLRIIMKHFDIETTLYYTMLGKRKHSLKLRLCSKAVVMVMN